MREPPVEEIVHKIIEAFHPRRIVMFGSRAKATAGPASDLDLFVELETDLRPLERTRAIDGLFGLRDWSMDVVVYTPQEVERFRDVIGTLLYTIEREGQLLYERV